MPLGPLLSSIMSNPQYYSHPAPYLRHRPRKAAPREETSRDSSVPSEADAAGGNLRHRVSSFSLLPRVQSTETMRSGAAAVGGGGPDWSAHKPDKSEAVDEEASSDWPDEPESSSSSTLQPDWRLRDRMKTVGVGLVLALNVGTDPPDITKPHPCAVLECWIDPRSVSRSKAKEIIGERLEQQYGKWQLARTGRPLKYRRALDPTVEDVRALCLQLRRQARNERILVHYNGHGVPRPTVNGEIWVFDKNHTEYIPLSIMELRLWMGKPSILVLDCSSAGILLPSFRTPLATSETASPTTSPMGSVATLGYHNKADDMTELASQWVNDTIVLCPCSENEWLPMSPDYPADIFTSCLTTPIPIALRWFVRHHPSSMSGLNPEAVDSIPGKANDRKTPLGELNWIFTAVTDSIAWNILPKPLFQRLFRQDLLVASMFRNFLLADRILRSLGCTPVSYPPLPPGMAEHPLWRAWDLACETLLFQLMSSGILGNHLVVPPPVKTKTGEEDGSESITTTTTVPSLASPPPPVPPPLLPSEVQLALANNVSSPFFSEQLTAFEVWLEFAAIHKMKLASGMELESPEQLPVVLQVLLSQVHRIRALLLLRRFLDLGPWAVNLSLSLGIFPYVMKLLQSPEYKSLLVSIWASILAFDPSCRVDLLKDGAFHHFVQHLMWGLDNTGREVEKAAKERTMAAFVLAVACHEYPAGQAECVRLNLHGNCCAMLSSYEQGDNASDKTVDLHLPAHFRLWLCMCLANMVKENTPMQNEAYSAGVHSRLFARLNDRAADVRAAVCYALGCLIGSAPRQGSRSSSLQDLQQASRQQQQQPPGAFAAGGLMPQRVPGVPNLIAPGGMGGPVGPGGLPGQLQPAIFANPGVPDLQWRPQHMEQMQPMGMSQQRPLAMQPSAQFLNQGGVLRQPQALQAGYLIPPGQQGMQPHPHMGGPTGFLVSGNPVVHQAQPQMVASHQLQQQFAQNERQRPLKPSVFEDRRRLELDLAVAEAMLKGMRDASVVVRYEATIALSCAVGKYLDAFIVAADDSSATNSPGGTDERKLKFPHPRGLDRKLVLRFGEIWKALRALQHGDPFPSISMAANKIVSFVHEQLLRFRMDAEATRANNRKRDEVHSMKLARNLAGIEEEISASGVSVPSGPSTPTGSLLRPAKAQSTAKPAKQPELRRALSESVSGPDGSMEESALWSSASAIFQPSEMPDVGVLSYTLPKSEFFDWKKGAFDTNFHAAEDETDLDPLSPEGAAIAYQERRNFNAKKRGQMIAESFACLAPKPPKPSRRSIEMLLEEEDVEAMEAAEEVASAKKNEVQLKEKAILRNEGVKMTSMLRFHPFEDVLGSCGATDSVSMWDTTSGNRLVSFENGNASGSRMTSSCWMNEETSSLFCVGCDDGTVRIWGELLEDNGEPCAREPSLVSAFHALPMKAGERGSGLVVEWQPFSGTMLAAGNAKVINCWDVQAERQSCQMETQTEANVTVLTTAWDFDQLGMGEVPQGYQGIGRDIVVAGHSDGSLKIFDLRMHDPALEMANESPQRKGRRRPTGYSEHKSWVVGTAFTGYAGRYELISGTVAGEIKAWDLRMSSSIRTLDVQRSTMTALSVHSKIPIVATGSHQQFIKVLTLDGDTLQVLRYHEKMASHRIGPVSCLAFHRYKPILAAGSTDTFIGLYTPAKAF